MVPLPLNVLESSPFSNILSLISFHIYKGFLKVTWRIGFALNTSSGSNKNGFTAFWQVDISGNVRQCKVIPFQQDGHRDHDKVIKEYTDKDGDRHQIRGCYQAGKEILKRKANLQQCFLENTFKLH